MARHGLIKQLLETWLCRTVTSRMALPDERPKGSESRFIIPNRTVENMHFYLDTFIHRRLTEDSKLDALGLVNTMLTETLYSRILGRPAKGAWSTA